MAIEVKIPAVGESITSGLLSAWLKKDGEIVKDGEPILTLETDKISTEIPAPGTGAIRIQVDAGQEVKIGQVVATIDQMAQGGSPPAIQGTAPGTAIKADTTPAISEGPASSQESGDGARIELSPAVRRLVEEEKIPLEKVQGTGKHGQVTKEDIVNYLESRKPPEQEKRSAPIEKLASPPAQVTPSTVSLEPAKDLPSPKTGEPSRETGERFTRRKMSPLRKKIAAQLVMAQQNAAMLTTFNEVDMSAVMQLRSRYQESFQKRHGIKLGFMSFFVKAVVDALQSVPAINARLDGDDLIENHFFDIGVAVGTERGLVVPVIRDAEKKSFAQLEQDIARFAAKAREGKLQLDELTGGVFTITNGGIYGSLLSTPILNPPQSGILGMHKIQNRPVAIGEKIEIRSMMYLALSYDHRVVDGREAVTFLVRVKECIEDPSRLLLQG
jgi:2-oxoglutarate dehydrogenase E2 component (dihydrolipoamide succinyltransferase)